MPHFIVEYSDNLSSKRDWGKLPKLISDAAMETGLFPLAGMRVRLYPVQEHSIADEHPDNAFVAIVVRIGAGRSKEDQNKAGQHIFDVLSEFFSTELQSGHFMLSLDIVENDPKVSFKANSIHSRLQQKGAA